MLEKLGLVRSIKTGVTSSYKVDACGGSLSPNLESASPWEVSSQIPRHNHSNPEDLHSRRHPESKQTTILFSFAGSLWLWLLTLVQ